MLPVVYKHVAVLRFRYYQRVALMVWVPPLGPLAVAFASSSGDLL